MKKEILILIVFTGVITMSALAQDRKLVNTNKLVDHPRILFLKDEERGVKTVVSTNAVWSDMHKAILQASDEMIALPTLERVLIGRRLLDKSREAIRRIFYLSYAWRMTGEEKYFLRAEKEMLAVSNFSDWNPTHFLDVAEMTMAAAIGYDWLYGKLSPASKQLIQEAILKKGIEPSLNEKYNGFLTANTNWNQVCNAGMSYGALAIWEDHPEISKQVIERALNSIPLSMNEYQPDGAYPEGYSYWDYGTSFNVMFLSAIEKVFASDFGLSATPGFLKTSGFLENMTANTGLCFNWGDSGSGGNPTPAMFWFATKNNDPSLLWVEKSYLQKKDFSKFTRNRLLPAVILWGKDFPLEKITEPKSKTWMGQGANPVYIMRTSWTDTKGIYVGFKAGSASVNHGHMDIGSFIMESDGVRWASDFGSQEYESLESKGIQVFGRTQDAQRWSIFRLNNYAHNTLTVDNQLQRVKGYAKIDAFSDKPPFAYATSDLSTVYENQLASVKRGVAIVDKKFVVVQDELKTLDKQTTVRWTMLTSAQVAITGKNTMTLEKEGKKLFLRVESPTAITMKTWSTEPTTSYDAANPGTMLIGFEAVIPANTESMLKVLLLPEREAKAKIKSAPLARWP
jgi:hypothetical protein